MSSTRPLSKIHLRMLRKIKAGKKIILLASPGMFRFSGDTRNMWATFLLDELRNEGMIDKDNQITAAGEILIIYNS